MHFFTQSDSSLVCFPIIFIFFFWFNVYYVYTQIEELDVEMRSLQKEKADYAAIISMHQKAIKPKLETRKHTLEYLQGFQKLCQEHEAKQQVCYKTKVSFSFEV